LFIPIVILAAIIAVANRQSVTFSLDPFSQNFPSVAFTLPLYLLVFFAILFGFLLGAFSVLLKRTRRRRAPDLAPVAKETLPLETAEGRAAE
jgi:uncharacterized integral membrane protein